MGLPSGPISVALTVVDFLSITSVSQASRKTANHVDIRAHVAIRLPTGSTVLKVEALDQGATPGDVRPLKFVGWPLRRSPLKR